MFGFFKSAAILGLILTLGYVRLTDQIHERALNDQIATIEHSINDPVTGWSARLAQCHTNAATLGAQVDSQNIQVEAWKEAAAHASATASARAAAARAASREAAKNATAILNMKPGADHCASALDLIRSQ